MSQPHLFSIPAGVPFLPRLADALMAGELVPLGSDPVAALAETTLYLPTRRAGRALHALLAERSAGRARILPRIVPLGEADAAESQDGAPGGFTPNPDLLPAIPPLERRLILTRLVQVWAKQLDPALAGLPPGTEFRIPGTPADAVALAADLENLMDGLATEDVPWEDLAGSVDTDYSRYFRLTLDFVRIAHETWPAILAGRDGADPARRRNALLAAETARIATSGHAGPVIAAGSTGSIPATARLIAAIANHPQGAVVLPGLDTDLDEKGWAAIHGEDDGGPVHGHPQFYLRRLVERFCGATRADVVQLACATSARFAPCRRLLSQVMRPAETTDGWADLPADEHAEIAAGTAGIHVVEAADEREEALAIAIALREALDNPGRTAALVTPDRALARRVAAELRRWAIVAEDSAGQALGDSAAGRLARLASEAAASEFAPARLLALLAHPSVTFGRKRAEIERGAAALEIGVLRGPAPAPGLSGLRAAFDLQRARTASRHDPQPRARLGEAEWVSAAALLDALDAAFAGFAPPTGPSETIDLVALAAVHALVLEKLTGGGDALDPSDTIAKAALTQLFDELAVTASGGVPGRFADYPPFFAALARGRVVPPQHVGAHRRVRILGLLEARLLHADRIVLGGLDEGVWPPAPGADPFLNRPMRERLGLTPPERRIGQTAHDFVQLISNGDAVVTRAAKRDGKPTVQSRFLARLRALAGGKIWTGMTRSGRRFLDLAQELDKVCSAEPIRRPQPRPGADAFPSRLSVTEIETLVRDPYAIYARHILRLDPLETLAKVPGAADFGTLLHDIVAEFTRAHRGPLPTDATDLFLAEAERSLRRFADAYPELVALWRPRLTRFAPDYIAWETERRAAGLVPAVEISGALDIPLSSRVFTLTARADRIEFGPNGEAAIVDFKTGGVPSDKEVAVGFAPQLTLEGAMLMEGAFRDQPRTTSVPALTYVKVGARVPLTERVLDRPRQDDRTMGEIVAAHRAGLEAAVRRYAETGAPYLSRPYPKYARAYAPYDHLARVAEWAATLDEGDQ